MSFLIEVDYIEAGTFAYKTLSAFGPTLIAAQTLMTAKAAATVGTPVQAKSTEYLSGAQLTPFVTVGAGLWSDAEFEFSKVVNGELIVKTKKLENVTVNITDAQNPDLIDLSNAAVMLLGTDFRDGDGQGGYATSEAHWVN